MAGDAPAAAARRIVVVDLDAFYASVEIRDDPRLAGRPVVVAGRRERGVVAAASYEARAFGIRSAMPTMRALEACPDLVVVEPRHARYREVAEETRAIFSRYSDIVEPASLDEAYIDVSALTGGTSATAIAEAIRGDVRREIGITASAGISYNRFIAKMASSVRKPDGQFVVRPAEGEAFVRALPIASFHGVGPATAARFATIGVRDGADLAAVTAERLERIFGRSGRRYHDLARGVDDRPVVPDRPRRSVGAETTFDVDARDHAEAAARLPAILDSLWERLGRVGGSWRTVTLKVKLCDHSLTSRSRSLDRPVADRAEVERIAEGLLRNAFPSRRPVRLIGVTLSGEGEGRATARDRQLTLAL